MCHLPGPLPNSAPAFHGDVVHKWLDEVDTRGQAMEGQHEDPLAAHSTQPPPTEPLITKVEEIGGDLISRAYNSDTVKNALGWLDRKISSWFK